jgi:hypothetical protein
VTCGENPDRPTSTLAVADEVAPLKIK